MNGLFNRFFKRDPAQEAGRRIFDAVAAQAREPRFFVDYAVPDTIDGRFDLLALQAAVAFRALAAKGGEAARAAQAGTDAMFLALDDALRELGVGDDGVARRVKDMGRAYLGRAKAYDEALSDGDRSALEAALARNLYRGAPPPPAVLRALAEFLAAESDRLTGLEWPRAERGEMGYAPPPALPGARP